MYQDEKYQQAMKQRNEMITLRSADIGNKLKGIFWLIIIEVACTTMISIVYATASLKQVGISSDLLIGLLICAGVIVVGAIVYGILLFSLRCYNDSFKLAGLAYVVYQVLNLLGKYFSDSGFSGFLSVLVFLVQIFHLKCFVDACAWSLREVDRGIEIDWHNCWKIYSKVLILSILCSFAVLIPLLGLIALFGMLILMVVELIVSVWMVVLVWKTAARLQLRGNSPAY